MSVQSSRGIILAANGNASGGYLQLPSNGSIDAPFQPDMGNAQRVVLTLSGNVGVGATVFTVAPIVINTNKYLPIGGGRAAPANTGGGAALNNNSPVLCVGQTSNSPGILSLTQAYGLPGPTGAIQDIIQIVGPLVGILLVRLTVTGVPGVGDSLLVTMDVY